MQRGPLAPEKLRWAGGGGETAFARSYDRRPCRVRLHRGRFNRHCAWSRRGSRFPTIRV